MSLINWCWFCSTNLQVVLFQIQKTYSCWFVGGSEIFQQITPFLWCYYTNLWHKLHRDKCFWEYLYYFPMQNNTKIGTKQKKRFHNNIRNKQWHTNVVTHDLLSMHCMLTWTKAVNHDDISQEKRYISHYRWVFCYFCYF
jgi:hypothetical protein